MCSLCLDTGTSFLGSLKYPRRAYRIDKGRVLLWECGILGLEYGGFVGKGGRRGFE